MKTITTIVYDYDELNNAAKEKARDWYREAALDYRWWDFVYEDAKAVGELLGIHIKDIGFSGFSSQGDGAHFVGSWAPAHDNTTAIKLRNDNELEQIATGLRSLPTNMSANVTHRGHYQHANCTVIEWAFHDDAIAEAAYGSKEWQDRNAVLLKHEADGSELLRDFMHWIYKQLEAEHDYLLSDEVIEDMIRANEYTFSESGEREG